MSDTRGGREETPFTWPRLARSLAARRWRVVGAVVSAGRAPRVFVCLYAHSGCVAASAGGVSVVSVCVCAFVCLCVCTPTRGVWQPQLAECRL